MRHLSAHQSGTRNEAEPAAIHAEYGMGKGTERKTSWREMIKREFGDRAKYESPTMLGGDHEHLQSIISST